MNIAIDARTLADGGSHHTYLWNLVTRMARAAPQDRFILYADRDLPEFHALPCPNLQAAPAPARVGALWNVTHLVPQMRRDRVDVLHAQYTLPPVGPAPCPMVVTIHDATFRLFPQWFPRRANWVQNLLIPRAARRAARVLTGSRSAAEDIHVTMRVPRTRVVVTPYGLDARFREVPQAEREEVRARYGLPAGYALGVGLLRARKNVAVVLGALRRLLAQDQWPPGAVLALTGDWASAPEDARLLSEDPRLAAHVRALGFVPGDDLAALYASATASVYPSLYEGFGFPVLEAMAGGCPVLASDTSSLPEVVGDAGVLLPPEDEAAWAEALRAVFADAPAREDLRRRGRAHVRQFTWERTAQETLAVYREVVQQRL